MKTKYKTLCLTTSVIAMVAITSNKAISQSLTEGPNHGISTIVIANKYPTWQNTSNIFINDRKYATVSLGTGATSDTLEVENFGFQIPNDAVIQGISVTIKKGANDRGIHDNNIKLIKNGIACGNEHADMHNWPQSPAVFKYGNDNDLWGTNWSAADINSYAFGIAISIANSPYMSDSGMGAIDYVYITVKYRSNGLSVKSFGVINTDDKVNAYFTAPPSNDNRSDMNVYPNPGKNAITIQFPASSNQSILLIMDESGRVVMNEAVPASNDSITTCVKDISELPTGVYVLLVNQDGKNYTKRFIKG